MVAVVLAAGRGSRLAPLSDRLPKPLCPVGNRALLDLALDRVESLEVPIAVNVHDRAAALRAHLEAGGRSVHVSHERPDALGTAGALGLLRGWVDGCDVVVVNADAWCPGDLRGLLEGWDGERPRVMVHGGPVFGPRVGLVASVTPWSEVRRLQATPSGLYEVLWRPAHDEGRLDVVGHPGPFVDCGTPADYLRANLAAARAGGGALVDPSATVAPGAVGGHSVVGPGAIVEGRVVDSVVWPGTRVERGEELVRSVRAARDLTVGPLDVASARRA
jgi:mannose-1-phosphate guanylyltransferase/MurNAc alpha-1-phosphate uridylyltransferase